jgi:beta-glucosidase/6-phospho-beta-glucosidase/beta-galactosidase
MGGWFADPLYYGDYPSMMRERLGGLLPPFTDADAKLLKGSMDYIALNYYQSHQVRYAPGCSPMELERLAPAEHPRTAMDWPIVPDGLRQALQWVAGRYPSLPIYITENGACFDDQRDTEGLVDDQDRIAYLHGHFAAAGRAITEGVDLRGYLVWSLLDNFEWSWGYAKRFGLVRCDYQTLERTVKASGRWYAEFIPDGRLKELEAARDDGSAGGVQQ